MRALFLLPLLFLSACTDYEPVSLTAKRHHIVHAFAPADPSLGLTDTERMQIRQLVDAVPPIAEISATIELRDPVLASSPRLQSLVTLLTEAGMPPQVTDTSFTDTLRPMDLVLEYTAFPNPDKCPVWEAPGVMNQWNKLYSHLGCSTAKNLQAQMADPLDLVRPRQDSRAETESAVQAIDRYRGTEGAVEATPIPVTSGITEGQ